MDDPLDLLHIAKIQKYSKKEEVRSSGQITAENLIKELPILEFKLGSIDSKNFTCACSDNDHIYIGSKDGVVHQYDYRENETAVMKPKKAVKSEVSCLDVLLNLHAIVGYSTGHIILWDLRSNKILHTSQIFSRPIIKVKFYKSVNQAVVLADQVHFIDIKKKLLKYAFTATVLQSIDKNLVTFELLHSDHQTLPSYLLVISFENLLIYSLETRLMLFNISAIRPDATPYTAWITGDNKYIVSISYSTTVAVYNILQEGFNATLCFEVAHDVCGMKWIKKDLLAVIGRYADTNIYMFTGRNKQIMQEIRINMDVKEQTYLVDRQGLPSGCFHNTITGNEKIIVIGRNKLCIFTMFHWNDCLEQLIMKEKWREALNLGSIFLQEVGFAFIDIAPNRFEVLKKLNEILSGFLRNKRVMVEEKIPYAMEFSIKFGMFDILFEQLFNCGVEAGNQGLEIFVREIQPYIINGVIRTIPMVSLAKIIDFLVEKNKLDTVENIILHLDPACLDNKLLLPVCDKYNLINAFIYINTQSSMQSFVNPLKKLYKLVSKATDTSKKQYFAYNLLWYIRLCYLGQAFPNEKIREELKDSVAIKVTLWLIKRKHIQGLLEVDSKATLSVLYLIFTENTCTRALGKEKTYPEVIKALESYLAPTQAYFSQYALFMIKANENTKVKLSKPSVLLISRHLINESPISDSENSNTSSYIISLLKTCRPYTPAEVSDLFAITRKSRYHEILAYLYQISGEYHEALLCYIQSDDPSNRCKVFAVIDDIFEELLPEALQNFKEILIRNLSRLAELNTDLVARLVTVRFHNEHSLTIDNLSGAPELQMKYLSDLLRSSSDVDEKLVLRYIRLLSEFDKDAVIGFLRSSEDYSYDDCLKVVTQFKNVEGISYIQEKLGSVKEAIVTVIDHLKDIKYYILKDLRESETLDMKKVEDLRYFIETAKDICERNSSVFSDMEYDENWYIVLNNSLDINYEFSQWFQKYPELKETLDVSIKEVLDIMINYVDFDALISQITKNHGSMAFKHFRESTITVLSRFSYSQNIISKLNSLVIKDKSNLTDKLIEDYSRGVCSDDFYCMKCKQDIERTTMLNPDNRVFIFDCGHTFHFTCIKVMTCEACRIVEARNKEFVNSLRLLENKSKR